MHTLIRTKLHINVDGGGGSGGGTIENNARQMGAEELLEEARRLEELAKEKKREAQRTGRGATGSYDYGYEEYDDAVSSASAPAADDADEDEVWKLQQQYMRAMRAKFQK